MEDFFCIIYRRLAAELTVQRLSISTYLTYNLQL